MELGLKWLVKATKKEKIIDLISPPQRCKWPRLLPQGLLVTKSPIDDPLKGAAIVQATIIPPSLPWKTLLRSALSRCGRVGSRCRKGHKRTDWWAVVTFSLFFFPLSKCHCQTPSKEKSGGFLKSSLRFVLFSEVLSRVAVRLSCWDWVLLSANTDEPLRRGEVLLFLLQNCAILLQPPRKMRTLSIRCPLR